MSQNKKLERNIYFFLLFLFLLSSSCRENPKGEKITIVFTNDLQGHILTDRNKRGGFSRVATVVNEIRRENKNTIFLDAGDSSVGTAFATETRGEAVYRLMNALGYDAQVFGNHEFDLGVGQAERYKEISRFPIIACNIRDSFGNIFAEEEYLIFNLGSLRLAVIGVANPETEKLVDPTKIEGLKFLDPEPEISRIQTELKDKVDLIVLLSHQGIKEDFILAHKLSGIFLIIGGHSEVKIKGFKLSNKVRIAQAGHWGYWLGRIDFYWDRNKKEVYNLHSRLIPIKEKIREDQDIKRLIENEEKVLSGDLNVVLGRIWVPRNKSQLGKWMAEILKKETGAHLGIINSGAVRAGLSGGILTKEDMYMVFPFDDHIAVFEMSGKELIKILPEKKFFFSTRPKIKPDEQYKVATIDFLLKKGEFRGAKNIKIFPTLLRDKMIEQLKKDKTIKEFWR